MNTRPTEACDTVKELHDDHHRLPRIAERAAVVVVVVDVIIVAFGVVVLYLILFRLPVAGYHRRRN